MHLFGNMLFLWIYGDNVERRLGGCPYLLAYLATGVVATLAHALVFSSLGRAAGRRLGRDLGRARLLLRALPAQHRAHAGLPAAVPDARVRDPGAARARHVPAVRQPAAVRARGRGRRGARRPHRRLHRRGARRPGWSSGAASTAGPPQVEVVAAPGERRGRARVARRRALRRGGPALLRAAGVGDARRALAGRGRRARQLAAPQRQRRRGAHAAAARRPATTRAARARRGLRARRARSCSRTCGEPTAAYQYLLSALELGAVAETEAARPAACSAGSTRCRSGKWGGCTRLRAGQRSCPLRPRAVHAPGARLARRGPRRRRGPGRAPSW